MNDEPEIFGMHENANLAFQVWFSSFHIFLIYFLLPSQLKEEQTTTEPGYFLTF